MQLSVMVGAQRNGPIITTLLAHSRRLGKHQVVRL
jgi:hypothetical protein